MNPWDGQPDPMLPPGSARCQCTGCGEYFGGVYTFDMHRATGQCLTPAQMRAKGLVRSPRGYWGRPAPVFAGTREESRQDE